MIEYEYEHEVRMECLRMAISHLGVDDIKHTTTIAGQLSDFILGTNDAEVICAARDLAEKVKGA